MPNNYFKFKQFIVEQSGSAMKVCTEACVFGALVHKEKPKNILDIGTGTGLLSLMLAQRYNCPVDAVELEEKSFSQAEKNFKNSPWTKRLGLYHTSIQNYAEKIDKKYDFIVSNPPFFTDHLPSPNKNKNIAHHNNFLSHKDLTSSIGALLDQEGTCYILLPPFEAERFDQLAEENGLFLNSRIAMHDSPQAPVLRFISAYTYTPQKVTRSAFYIKEKKAGEYSTDFLQLLQPFYLYL